MIMKKNIKILITSIILICLVFPSCKKNFLDKAPGVDINEDVIFSAKVQTEKYVANMYQLGMPSIFAMRPADMGLGANAVTSTLGVLSTYVNLAGITDEAINSQSNDAAPSAWNNGGVTNANILLEDLRYYLRWQAIRTANILLERIDEVPDADATYKNQVKGEALFFRAINNFEILKRYGGFPLVLKRVTSLEESKIERSSFEACVNSIVKDCDDAVGFLPLDQPGATKGRAQKGAALAVKARTLLYAASPLFNTATPISSFGNATDDKLISYGNYSLNRWKIAADAAKEVLIWAQAAGYTLVDDPAKRINTISPTVVNLVVGNYRDSWEKNDNSEIIIANKTWGSKSAGQFPLPMLLPRTEFVPNSGAGWNGPSIIFNHVRKYEKRATGLPQDWNYAGGNDLLQKYAELDPRFAQSVIFTGARMHKSVVRTPIGEHTPSKSALNSCQGGHWNLKFVNDGIDAGTGLEVNCPILRLNEFYLAYAEAMNEFEGPGVATPINITGTNILTAQLPAIPNSALDAVNKIRLRSAMPAINTSNAITLRSRIHNEWDIEMYMEDHRLWNSRRWLEAENDGVLKGSMWGLVINKLNDVAPYPTAFSYRPFVFMTRSFPTKLYLHPFVLSEVQKGNLKQNPGW
ncbi:RagB/SusD family nutrient uptake outer membrane protein [Pedobacter psychrodurus]|uniref:RagB/SusD family nutrient uptake outer membrane protein n=2 Tax=Pedobacter psychrodurus TaxID=2530456 RepID=A0A4V6N6L1_9SPHI|nr:RagB/SusD family nutrient uptake outer membrane protein [Pedobacter psychrodurus]